MYKIMIRVGILLLLLTAFVSAGPLHDAAAEGRLDDVKDMVERQKIAVDKPGYLGETALYQAASRGNLDIVEYLLGKGAKVDATDQYGGTPLREAAVGGHLGVMKVLIKAKADVDHKGQYGHTITQSVADTGYLDENARANALTLLLESGANPKATLRGASLLHLLARGGHLLSIEVLVKAGLSPDIRDSHDLTPLHAAAAADQAGSIRWLIKSGATVDARSKDQTTPLMKAAAKGYEQSVRALLEGGASREARNSQGQTALDRARANGKNHVIELLEVKI
jgi:ankyrin repeat protein